MSEFSKYNPIINLIYFVGVIVFAMILTHPICLAISLVGGVLCEVLSNGKKSVRLFAMLIPLMIVSAVINPMFNHSGVTILLYLPSQNPLTLESMLYGGVAAIMIATVICYFSSFNKIMTSDKIIYLFGRLTPSLSLIISMTLRFVPQLKKSVKETTNAQKCLGRNVENGTCIERAKNGIRVFSSVITQGLEKSIETSDSMHSRGYGTGKRTSYSNYRFDKRDIVALIYLAVMIIYVAVGIICDEIAYSYFPSLSGNNVTFYGITVFGAYALLCILPVAIEIWEGLKWKKLKSKI